MAAADSEAVLDAGATVNLGRFRWLDHRDSVLEKFGDPPAQPPPAWARFKLGTDRLGEARYAADSPAGVAGGRGKLAASLMEGGIPASLRIGSLATLGGQLGPPRNVLTLGKFGIDVPLEVAGKGRRNLYQVLNGTPRRMAVHASLMRRTVSIGLTLLRLSRRAMLLRRLMPAT